MPKCSSFRPRHRFEECCVSDRLKRLAFDDKHGSVNYSIGALIISTLLTPAASLMLFSNRAEAACSSGAPGTGPVVTCDASPPNPATTAVNAAPGSTAVTVNIQNGSALAIARTISVTAVSVVDGSIISSDGSVSLSGGGGSGLNRGAGLLGSGSNNVITNGALGIVGTTGAYNDGMAADGSGNTLINNGTITTAGPNAYGMTASWGQSGGGQPNNTLINNGSVTTNGSNARAASILGQNGLITNTGTLLTNGASSTGAYLQGTNDRLINSGIIRATGIGSEGVFSNTAGSGFTARIDNLAGGQIISDQGTALRTLNGATTITNAGLISGGNGTALSGGNGNVTFILQTGSQIIGAANGGAGANVVRLQGSGTAANPFVNFQTLIAEGTDWTWSGSGTFADTFVNSGVVRLQSSLTGNVTIAPGTSLLAGNGANPTITPFPGGPPITVTNAGTVDLTNGGSPAANSLTIAGNYVGNGGQLNVRSVLGTDGAPSDRLVISGGQASGATGINVTNAGGTGGLTLDNGILVVQATAGATTTPSAFALNGGSVMAGAYQYYLFRGGVSAGTQDNWYLRSTVPAAPAPGTPAPAPADNTPPLPPAPQAFSEPLALYRPEVALYSAVPAVARQLGIVSLGTFHDRNGEQSLLTGQRDVSAGWARIFGGRESQQWSGAAAPAFDGSFSGVQSGIELLGRDNDTGHRDRIGLLASYGRANGRVSGFSGGFQNTPVGSLSLDATSLGAYWTHVGPSGWYVDAVAAHAWYTGSPFSVQGLQAATNGTGIIASIESGVPIAIAPNLTLEPQAQLIYQNLALDPSQDAISRIDYGRSDALTGRLGGRLVATYRTASALLQPYLKVNVWHDFAGTDGLVFAASDFITTQRRATAYEVGGGVTATLSQAVAVFVAAGYIGNLDRNNRETIQGNVGVRLTW